MRYILDTNVFNRILDGNFSLNTLPDGSEFVATPIQYEELKATPDSNRLTDLLAIFQCIGPEIVNPSFSFDIPGAGFDEGAWSNNDLAKTIKTSLDCVNKKPNNWQDALIAGAAKKHGCTLVTADKTLAKVAEQHEISVLLIK